MTGTNVNESIQAFKKISLSMDIGEKNDNMSMTKASVRNIEDIIISARVTGLMKVFPGVVLFISNLYILNGELGTNLHRKLSIYQLSAYNKFNIFLSPQNA